MNIQEGERDPYCEGVDACRDCEQEHGPDVQRVIFLFTVAGTGFFDHIGADEAQQDEGDPVVYGCDLFPELDAQKIADSRHQGLKTAEP